jgi:MIP family channel proteins
MGDGDESLLKRIIHPGTIDDLKDLEVYRGCLAEFIALAIFNFVSACSVCSVLSVTEAFTIPALVSIALAHGLCISVLVYSFGNISGGHVNPAVTIALSLRGVISFTRGLLYIGSQILGSMVGAAMAKAIIPEELQGTLGATTVNPLMNLGQAFAMEMWLTFFLVLVIFLTAVDEQGAGELAPLAIGLIVVIDHLIGIPFTGASMNPARSFGTAVAGGTWDDHWVYWVGPISGAIIAAAIYSALFEWRKLSPKEEDEGKPQYDRVAKNSDDPSQHNRSRTRTRIATVTD